MTLDPVDREAIVTAFAGDAPARADRIEQLLELLRTSSSTPAREAVTSLDFEAHTVRGSAATVGLQDIVEAAQELELACATWDPVSAESKEAIVTRGARLVGLLRGVGPEGPPVGATVAPEDPGTSRRIVLHIEDNASNLKLVERILERRPDVELAEARTGGKGLALAATLRPSLVVLDLRLPDLSGEDVLRRLRADEATRHTPVIVVSAEARPAEADRVLAAGADDYLVKPIDVTNFLEVVDRMLARTRR
jgi:CheY-like chemotaxis protein/HPt (histidine-containing phosphotransfer) domain-containing protein